MRILYAAGLGGTSLHRLHALERLGHDVTPFDFNPYLNRGGRLGHWLRMRSLVGPTIRDLNRDLLSAAQKQHFDLIWLDKAQLVQASTVEGLKSTGATTAHYSSDLPSRVRGEPGWRLFREAAAHYDRMVVPSPGHEPEYRQLGVKNFIRMPFGFEPALHRPPPPDWSDKDRPYDVCYVGTPYEQRPQFLLELKRRHGIRVQVFGDRWDKVLSADEMTLLNVQPGQYEQDYVHALWSSKICLGFVTHAMAHGSARRWTEIAACGAFLLAEQTDEADAWFKNGEESVFFKSVDDCAERIKRFLDDETSRQTIARSGLNRVTNRLSNDRLLKAVLDSL